MTGAPELGYHETLDRVCCQSPLGTGNGESDLVPHGEHNPPPREKVHKSTVSPCVH